MHTHFTVLLAAIALIAAPRAPALILTDDLGTALRLERPAQRVIALSPHLTELMYSIGAGDRLAGVVRGSDYPAAAASLPEIGDAAGLDFERILDLRPDVVLAWGGGNRAVDIARLRALGLVVLVLDSRRLEDIARDLRLLGELTGQEAHAGLVAGIFERRVAALRDRYAGRADVRVLFEIWHRPLFTVNRTHLISNTLALCGATNVFEDLRQTAGEISLEQVLVQDPDAIVIGSEAHDTGVDNWAAYSYLKAVRTGMVFTLPADLITRPTPRIIDAAEDMCAKLDNARH